MRSTNSRKLGSRRLRGCGSVTLISLNILPGLLPNTKIRSHISTASSMLCVTRMTPLMGMRPSAHKIQEIGAQRLRGQHIESGKRLVHEQDVRMYHQRTGKAHPLPHAAGQLARIGGLETVEPDQIDGGQGALADFAPRHVLRLQTQRDIFEDGEPGKQRETLKHHGDAACRTGDGLPQIGEMAGGRLRQTRDQPQQGRLARTRPAEQTHDLPLAQLEVHALEHQQILAIGLGKCLAHVGALQ